MGFTIKIPLSRLGKLKKVWVFGEYGLSGLWFKGEFTVPTILSSTHTGCSDVRVLHLVTISARNSFCNACGWLDIVPSCYCCSLGGVKDGNDILTWFLRCCSESGWTEPSSPVVASRTVATGKTLTIAAGSDVSPFLTILCSTMCLMLSRDPLALGTPEMGSVPFRLRV
jgi:hypothetical protein